MWNRSYLRYVLAGALMFAIGFAIGSTQNGDTGFWNTVAAILGTLGAAVTVIAGALEIVRRIRMRRSTTQQPTR